MTAEDDVVCVHVGRVDNIPGLYLRLLDGFCVIHIMKNKKKCADAESLFCYILGHGRTEKNISRSIAGGTPVRSA